MISLTKYVLQLLGFLLCYQMSSKYMSSKGVPAPAPGSRYPVS